MEVSTGQKYTRIITIATILMLLAVVTYVTFSIGTFTQNATKQISSFEACAADGRPILETYPERCITADGRSFTKQY